MRTASFALAALTSLSLTADTQKRPTTPAAKAESKERDILRFLEALGMPQANSDAARNQISAAAKDPKLSAYPAAYWKDYQEAASPDAFRKFLLPIFDKAYSQDELRAFLKLLADPDFKKAADRNPEALRLFFEKHPAMLKGKAFETFSAYMTEVGKKLREKHGIKAPEHKK